MKMITMMVRLDFHIIMMMMMRRRRRMRMRRRRRTMMMMMTVPTAIMMLAGLGIHMQMSTYGQPPVQSVQPTRSNPFLDEQ